MVARAYLQDTQQNLQFTLLSDNAHGCGGMSLGALEVMLHRRCRADDGRGVGETLNESTHIQPSLWLLFDDPVKSAELHRILSIFQQFPLTISAASISKVLVNTNYSF